MSKYRLLFLVCYIFVLVDVASARENPACFGWGTVLFPYTAMRVERCLTAGGNPNAAGTTSGMSALMFAAREGDREAVWLLLANGANPNARARNGETALMKAAWDGHIEIVSYLLKSGADVNAQTKDGKTALILTPARHSEVRHLLQRHQ